MDEKTNDQMLENAIKSQNNYKMYKMETMKKVSEARKKLEQLQESNLSEKIEITENKFKEAELMQEYNSLINSAKGYDLNMKEIQLLIDTLNGKIDKFKRAEDLKQIKIDKENLDKQSEFYYTRDEVEKCKLAIEMYENKSDKEQVELWKTKLESAEKQFDFAKKEMPENIKETKEQDKEKTTEEKQDGYSREEQGKTFIEKQEQILTNYSGEELGNRIIIETTEIDKGTRKIETVGTLKNEDGEYSYKEISEVTGDELQLRTKELNVQNKNNGNIEKHVYKKDEKGNENFYSVINGRTSFRIIKNAKGITIENYEDGQLVDNYEYDENGNALIAMGDIEKLEENYVEEFFDNQKPYFEAVNKDLEKENSTISTQDLGKQTLEQQKNVEQKDKVQSQINQHMREIDNQKSTDEYTR